MILDGDAVVSVDTTLGALFLLVGLGALWIWKRWRTEQRRNAYIDHILESLGGWWCVWHPRDGIITCNTRFQTLMHVPSSKHPHIQDWLDLFEPDTKKQLQDDLKTLIEKNKPFQKVCEIPSQADFFEIKGTLFHKDKALIWIQNLPDDYFLRDDRTRILPQAPPQVIVQTQRNKPLEAILNHIPIIIWCREQATQKLVLCNQAYAEAVELTIPEVLERNALLFQDGHLPESQSSHYHKHVIIKGERCLLDICETRIDGYDIGYAFDVSDIEHYKNETQRYLQAHQEVLELVSVPIAVYSADKRLQFFNTAYARLSGIDAYWLEQKPTLSEVLEELRVRRRLPEYADFPAYKKKQAQHFTTMIEPIEEMQHLPDDRTIRMVMYPHPLGGLLFVFEDVTDKLSLERQYNTLIDVQQETLDHLYEGIVVFGSDNRLELTNPAFGKLWGLNAKQLSSGGHISTIVEAIKPYCHYGPDWDVFKTNIISSVTDRIPKSGRLERTDGSILSFSYVPLPDGGHLLSYFDVTDSSKVEHALRERNEALEKADQMKSEFIANISYELREPLNTIVGFTEVLTNQYLGGLNDKQMEYSKAVLNSSQKLLSLINDLLDLASIEGGYFYLKKGFFDVFQIASSLTHHFQAKAEEKGLTLSLDCSQNLGLFWADETRFKQIIFNLLQNSVNYSVSGGSIRLAIKKDDEFLWMRVVDTGIGIPQSELGRIFEKFERIALPNDQTHGAGLGLSLVKHFTQMHGGTVHIQSQQGKGTTVECRFPLQDEEMQDESHHDNALTIARVSEPLRMAATGS